MLKCFFVLLFIGLTYPGFTQDKVSYELTKNYSSQSRGSIDYFIQPAQSIEFSYRMNIKGLHAKQLTGTLKTYLSGDTTLDHRDELVFELEEKVEYFHSGGHIWKHSLSPGQYYLLSVFEADDTTVFAQKSNVLVQSVSVFDIHADIHEAYFYDVEINEYSNKTGFYLDVGIDLSCCTSFSDYYSGTFTVYLSPTDEIKDSSKELGIVYKDIAFDTSYYRMAFERELYESADLSKHDYLILKATGYMGKSYAEFEDKTVAVPLKAITNIKELNRIRSKKHPFLTHGDFHIDASKLEGLNIDTVLHEAAQFYKYLAAALKAGAERDYKDYLKNADSAFSLAGSNKEATLFYANTSILSGLYHTLIDILEDDSLYRAPYTREALNFRLGAAMDMEDFIEKSYERLSNELIPEGLYVSGKVEESGYFDSDAIFQVPFLTENPILWKDASLPVLAHFVRQLDFEAADRMINKLDRHQHLLIEAWSALAAFQGNRDDIDLGADLIDYNDMLDYSLLKLHFYTLMGQFDEGKRSYERAGELFRLSNAFAPDHFWMKAANFFEAIRDFDKADSLYQLVDHYYQDQAKEYQDQGPKARALLQSFHSELLAAKLDPSLVSRETAEEYIDLVEAYQTEGYLLDVIEFFNQKELAEMIGHFGNSAYAKLYQRNIDRLEEQGQYIQTATWLEDLAYFAGRDEYYEAAMNIYGELFFYENIKMRAFRNSFSEEAQIFYARQQQDIFSRFINLLLEVPEDSISADRLNEERVTAFDRAMAIHSFVLRSNYMLLYKIFESEDEYVQQQYEVWKAYRHLLNEQYIENDQKDSTIRTIKKAIARTEKNLIRNTRDSTTYFASEGKTFHEVRNQLKEREAAIEIVRIRQNHKVYYGDEITYLAFLVTPESETPRIIPITTNGKELESKRIQYYRSAIRYQLKDTESYNHFWKPIANALPDSLDRIYFALDGVYHLINPSALFNPETGKYLLEESNIHLVPTLSMIGEQEKPTFSSASLFGYPAFINSPTNTTDTIATNRASLLENEIMSLPGTKTEVEKISEVLKQNNINVEVFIGEMVSKNNIHDQQQQDILHFATHGFWVEDKHLSGFESLYESLSKSGLVLAGAQTRTADGFTLENEGLLTAAEIQNMFLFGTDLVVLSACQTGLGEIVPGEGIFGLKRAFQKAGAKHLVASLWKVDDHATQQFMRFFYQKLGSKDLQTAFREAAIELKEQYPEPYYWGAFTLTSFY